VLFSVAGLSMVIGPPLGGYITDAIGWRWVFYINVPIVVVTMLAVLTAVPYVRSSASWRDIDFLGVATLIAGLAPILIGLSLAGDGRAWSATSVIVPIVVGAVMLGAFGYTETRVAAHPIVPFDLFKSNQFAVMIAVAFFSAFAMMGTLFFVPLLYQSVLGISATFSGSLLIPLTLALMVVPPFAGKALSSMARYRYLGTLAFAAMVAGLLMLTAVNPGSGRATTVVAMALVGLGIGIAFPMATSVVQSAVPMKLLGAATSQVQFWRMIAGPVAIAVLGTLMSGKTGATASPQQLASALHEVFLVAGLAVALGLVATLFLKEVPLRKMPSMARKKKKSATPVSETV
jgi:MFS family permease